jgi:hypothetical protein
MITSVKEPTLTSFGAGCRFPERNLRRFGLRSVRHYAPEIPSDR